MELEMMTTGSRSLGGMQLDALRRERVTDAIRNLPGGAASDVKAERRTALMRACDDFHAIFLQMSMKHARHTTPRADFLGNGQGEKIFEGLLDGELARKVSGEMGLGRALYEHFVNQAGLEEPEASTEESA